MSDTSDQIQYSPFSFVLCAWGNIESYIVSHSSGQSVYVMKADETIWENLDLSHDACVVFFFVLLFLGFFWLNFTIISCWMPQIILYLRRISAIFVTDWSINDAFKMQGNVSQQGEKCSPLQFPSFHVHFCFSYCADIHFHSRRSSRRGHWWWCCLIPGRRGKDRKVEDKQINSGQGSVV